ncbi:allophanate hydrolase-related protein [Haloglycomyces albus]|uniref:allophanate hydrolase-related protein n=1 Tax=Haloglycomyces albus TaxID=526067 RepID=UPI00046CE1BC|nr:gamma-glutamylcyclotransferase [Haloglycomyces albus]
MVYMFLNGGAMRGGPLHHHLKDATFVAEQRSAPLYHFYAVRDEFPGMIPAPSVAEGKVVHGELYDIPLETLEGYLLPNEPVELELGAIRLADGRATLAMILRQEWLNRPEITDISISGSWNQHMEDLKK